MTDLYKLFLKHKGKLVHKWDHYFHIYERYFSVFRDKPVNLLEIGIGYGGSLQLWSKYFHPESWICGIDIENKFGKFKEKHIHPFIGDQANLDFLKEVIIQIGRPDIIIDDGSHKASDIIASFEYLYPLMADTGVYLVEDVHTSYISGFGSFIGFAVNRIDDLNAQHIPELYPKPEFMRITKVIHFYDSVIVFEKEPQEKKFDVKRGKINRLYSIKRRLKNG